jgi:hypothetical protein
VASDNLPIAYQVLCTSYHNIDEFRGKLLQYLPLATGAGLLFAAKDNHALLHNHPVPLGLFGLVVALGLFSYEIYGIKKCGALITRGKEIERLLGFEGQFRTRPHAVWGIVAEPFAAGLIYSAVVASWVFLVFLHHQIIGWIVSGSVFAGLSLAVVVWDLRVTKSGVKTCDACGTSLTRPDGTRMRMRLVKFSRDNWFCDRCYEEVNSWLRAKRPGVNERTVR